MPDGEELSGVGRTSGARNELVAGLMREAVAKGKCPFCSPYFEEKNGERVITFDGFQPRHWKVWHNPSPMSGTSYHIMLAPHDHVRFASELLTAALVERELIAEELLKKFRYASFTEFTRQGVGDFNSATVFHLHYHIVVSSGEAADVSQIPSPYVRLIEHTMPYVDELASITGIEPLEALDKLREYIDVYREANRGKAIPIRAKFSNKIGQNTIDQSP